MSPRGEKKDGKDGITTQLFMLALGGLLSVASWGLREAYSQARAPIDELRHEQEQINLVARAHGERLAAHDEALRSLQDWMQRVDGKLDRALVREGR